MSGAMDTWNGDNADRSFSPTTVFPPIPAWATKREPYCDGIHYERSPTAELFCHNIDFEETVIPAKMVMSANHHVDGSTGLVHQQTPWISIRGHGDEPIHLDIEQATRIRDALDEMITATQPEARSQCDGTPTDSQPSA